MTPSSTRPCVEREVAVLATPSPGRKRSRMLTTHLRAHADRVRSRAASRVVGRPWRAAGPVVVAATVLLADVRLTGHGLTMTNSSRPRRASAKQTRPVLAPADTVSTHRPQLATGGARRRASAQQRQQRQQAEDLVCDAWEASGERRAVLAREALALWPDCADAYVLLAQATASNLEQACDLLQQGVAAGERALGPGTFADGVGDFWMIFETRPYMRARAALAATLWRLGRREEAIDHQRDLLALNPRDNQGLRFRQTHWLLELGAHDELDALFAAHADESAPASTPRRSPRSLAAATRRQRAPCASRRASSTHTYPTT